jgi:hypothetical protein
MYTRKQLDTAATVISEAMLALDSWPYSDQFEPAFQKFCRRYGATLDRNQFWRLCLSVRKRGLLVAKYRQPSDQLDSKA